MPKGFASVKDAAADIEARKAQGGGDNRLWLKLEPGQSARVRFLEQGNDIAWAWMHQLPPRGNQKWGDDIPCLDQDDEGKRRGVACPGCEAGDDRAFSGFINLIWRDGPVFKRTAEGWFEKGPDKKFIQVGTADVIAVWNRGIRDFEELMGKDAVYKGLMSRDFVVTREGSGLDTKYKIEPYIDAEGNSNPQPLSDKDKQLLAEKHDFTKDVTPTSYEEYMRLRQGGGSSEGVRPEDVRVTSPFGGQKPEGDVSAFMKS